MKILVIAISRLGDLIQSGPFLRRLRVKYPAAQIDLLVESRFREAAELLPAVDYIKEISIGRIVSGLASGEQGNLALTLRNYREDLLSLSGEQYHEVWNLTHTKASAVLAKLIGGKRALGASWSEQGTQIVRNKWLKYFYAANLARPWCQFNLVDIYANAIDGIPWASERHLRLKTPTSARKRSGDRAKRIVLHAGASQVSKVWRPELYTELVRSLSRAQTEIVVVGKSAPDFQADIAHLPSVRNLTGRTSFEELAKVVADSDLMITTDSGPMHVAAAVGTPIVVLALGSATAWETAPYGTGHIVIEHEQSGFTKGSATKFTPAEQAALISVTLVSRITNAVMQNASEQELRNLSLDAPCDVYYTGFSDSDHMLTLTPLNARPSKKCRYNRLFRTFWLTALEADNVAVAPENCLLDDEVLSSVYNALPLVRQCAIFAWKMETELTATMPQHSESLQQSVQQISLLEHKLSELLNQNNPLSTILRYHQINRGSLEASGLVDEIKETRLNYQFIETFLSRLAAGSRRRQSNSPYVGEQPCVSL